MEAFDEASRGPVGSFNLLTSRYAKSLASIGAIITILAIAIDPFFQQIVAYPLRSIAVDRNGTQGASLLRAIRYEEIGPFGGQQMLAPAILMQKALYGSLFNGATSMTASCSSGNCTWDAFTTLGVCNQCQDVSHLIKRITMPNPAYDPDLSDPTIKQTSRYQTPNGLHVTLPDYVDGLGDYFPAIINSNGMALLMNIPSIPWTIMNASIMSNSAAFECSVFWCLKSYQSSMTQGSLSEISMSTTDNPTTYDLYNGTEDANDCASDPRLISYGLPTTPSIGQPVYVYAPNTSLADECVTHLSNSAGVFRFSESAHRALQGFLQALFTGNLTWRGLDSFEPSSAVMQSVTTYGQSSMNIFSNNGAVVRQASRAFAGNITLGNIPEMINNLTESMTICMRQAATEPNSTLSGTVFETQAVVQIRWKWLALPILLLVGTTSFLGTCIRASKQRQTRPWKSSSTALLFHGLDRGYLDRVVVAEKRTEMDSVAKAIKVQLVETDGGWRLL